MTSSSRATHCPSPNPYRDGDRLTSRYDYVLPAAEKYMTSSAIETEGDVIFIFGALIDCDRHRYYYTTTPCQSLYDAVHRHEAWGPTRQKRHCSWRWASALPPVVAALVTPVGRY